LRETKTLPLAEFKVTADKAVGTFEGRASTFGSVDSYGDVVDNGAYRETIPQFLTRGFISWGHDWANPIGMVTAAEERSDGLWVTGEFHSDEESQRYRQRAKERLDAGKFMGLSIGYEAEEWEMRKVDEPVRTRWGDFSDEVRALTKIKLYEVSLVTVPAEPMAGLSSIKGYDVSFGDHAAMLRDAVAEFRSRCEAGCGADVKVGRAISANRRRQIESVIGMMSDAVTELAGLIAEAHDGEDGDEDGDEEDPVVGLGELPETSDLKAIYQRLIAQESFYAHAQGRA